MCIILDTGTTEEKTNGGSGAWQRWQVYNISSYDNSTAIATPTASNVDISCGGQVVAIQAPVGAYEQKDRSIRSTPL